MDRTRQILNKELSVEKTNSDSFLKIKVDNTQRLLPLNEIDKIVNIAERFNIERSRCSFYRILGSINPTISNPLFNLNDGTLSNKFTWSWFNSTEFLVANNLGENDKNFSYSVKNYLKEKDGWFGVFEPDKTKSSLCGYYDMEPKRERFSFLNDLNPYGTSSKPVKNWELSITYPHSSDKTHSMVNGGLLITSIEQALVSTRNMTAFSLSCKHNLMIGDTVRITGTNGYDGDYVVIRTGHDNGDDKEYTFVIDKPFVITNSINNNSRFKKIIGNVESEYYFRIFKKIKTRTSPVIETDDYETYRLAFSENAYNDSIIQFVFNEEIDVKDLTDNLGRPLSELYLTIIKTDSNKLFTQVKSGIDSKFNSRLINSGTIPYLRDIPMINRIHNGVNTPFISHNPLENNVNIGNDLFYGDLVEYNTNNLTENILSSVVHSFNTINRESNPSLTYETKVGLLPPNISPTKTISLGPRYEGYYYKPHHLIKIREFSSYIEYGDEFTGGMPTYATPLPDGTFAWRDLLDLGVNQTDEKALDYPFLNNAHYLYDNYCFTLKRQDPYAIWGLYYSKFPEDPIGDRINDKYEVKEQDDVC